MHICSWIENLASSSFIFTVTSRKFFILIQIPWQGMSLKLCKIPLCYSQFSPWKAWCLISHKLVIKIWWWRHLMVCPFSLTFAKVLSSYATLMRTNKSKMLPTIFFSFMYIFHLLTVCIFLDQVTFNYKICFFL